MSALNDIKEYYDLPSKLARKLETHINEGEMWPDVKWELNRNYPDVYWKEIRGTFIKLTGCSPEDYIDTFKISQG